MNPALIAALMAQVQAGTMTQEQMTTMIMMAAAPAAAQAPAGPAIPTHSVQTTTAPPPAQVAGAGSDAALLAQIKAGVAGIGASSQGTDHINPPSPGNVRRDLSLPPEKNILPGSFESISYVQITGGKAQNTRPKPGEHPKTYLTAKGRLIETTGDTVLGSEVGFQAWPGDFYLQNLKNILCAVYGIVGAQANDETYIMNKIDEAFGAAQTMVGKVVGCKCFVHTTKKEIQMFKWLLFPATATMGEDGKLKFQPLA